MLKLHNHDKSLLPEKRLFERKPFVKVVFIDNKMAHVITLSNN
ncbi:hypothetical protein [Flavobacterium album]|nr:hypothetical protein [Flavobacterium album]